MPTISLDATLSVVSHGQGALIRRLLSDIHQGVDCSIEIVLTLNLPEDESFLEDFAHLPIRLIRNTSPKGFGANHNAAFAVSQGRHFVIVNPDIRAHPFSLTPLLREVAMPRVAACAPLVLNAGGTVEDSAREFPSIWRLSRRVLARLRGKKQGPDYQWQNSAVAVDWLAGMFVLFKREAFAEVGGFDERFFMYMEDADICRRLRRQGWDIRLHPGSTVIHDAQRASHRSAQHLRWHLRSAVRYLTGL